MNILKAVLATAVAASLTMGAYAAASSSSSIFVRTEHYPRPPYSGATYYIYEQDGSTICTKLHVCNKYDYCTTTYHKGSYKAPVDQETGEPFGSSPPALIPSAKLSKHVCLVRYKLGGA